MVDMLKELGMEERIISAEPLVSALRERKSPVEIEYMREAIRHTEEIFELVTGYIRPGVTENDIARFMKAEVKKRELGLAWEPTVCPAVFTGPDNAGAHYAPGERVVERGHILNMDFGVRYKGYCSDMQRTFYILKEGETKAPADVQKGFDTIVRAIEESGKAVKIGGRGLDVDKAARDVVVNAGYDEFPHALGHQVGRFSHDGTAILGPAWEKYAQKPFKEIEKNMVFTLEPRLPLKAVE
jgi:Xaa-Pro aminopeptidase